MNSVPIRVSVELEKKLDPGKRLQAIEGVTVTKKFKQVVLPQVKPLAKGEVVSAVGQHFEAPAWITDRQAERLLGQAPGLTETEACIVASRLLGEEREKLAPKGGSTVLFTKRWVVRIYTSHIKGYVIDAHNRGTWEWKGSLNLFSIS